MKLFNLFENENLKKVNINNINYGGSIADRIEKIRLKDGSTPEWLFRYISDEELKNILKNNKMIPSVFYKRIHASIKPLKKYMEKDGHLLAIKYDDSDGWKPKLGHDEFYAVTWNSISIDKLYLVEDI